MNLKQKQMTVHSKIINYITKTMIPGKWYPVTHPEEIKSVIPGLSKDFELTFNETYTRVKLTLWEGGKPKI